MICINHQVWDALLLTNGAQMQILELYLRLTESEGVVPNNLCFNKPSIWFWCTFKLKKPYPILILFRDFMGIWPWCNASYCCLEVLDFTFELVLCKWSLMRHWCTHMNRGDMHNMCVHCLSPHIHRPQGPLVQNSSGSCMEFSQIQSEYKVSVSPLWLSDWGEDWSEKPQSPLESEPALYTEEGNHILTNTNQGTLPYPF